MITNPQVAEKVASKLPIVPKQFMGVYLNADIPKSGTPQHSGVLNHGTLPLARNLQKCI